jgi:uncharacterized protein YcbX
MFTVASLWRHPIKSHGREALETVSLVKGQTMPWDRHWAVTHADTKFDTSNPNWVMCRNFMIGALTPELAGIWATLDEESATISLRHLDLGEITFAPDDAEDVARFIAWLTPICPADKRLPDNVVKVPNLGLTDSPYPSLSIMTNASHAAVEGMLGKSLETERWRGNIWLEGPTAWEEFNWMDRNIQIGTATLHIKERIGRCNHTKSNPITGVRDADTLEALKNGWDHTDFGIYAEVIESGKIKLGDEAKVL